MDLRSFNLTESQILMGKQFLGYQPFIISDNVQTGNGYACVYGEGSPVVMEKDNVSEDEWGKFTEANARMRKMYDDWIDAICAIVDDLSGLSVVDTGCNSGYFLYRFWERGIRKCVGYDRSDMTAAINLLNRITGYKIRFVHEPYNPLTHKIKGCDKYDITVSSAIMCHLSDPLYYISFLGSITRKALLLHTSVSEEKRYIVSYGKPNRYYKEDPFPVCFDNDVTLSRGLLFESLRLAGFRHIQEVEYNPEWLLWKWFRSQKVLIALKEARVPDAARTWNISYHRRERLKHTVYSVLGSKRFATFTEFVKSRPRLKSFIERIMGIIRIYRKPVW